MSQTAFKGRNCVKLKVDIQCHFSNINERCRYCNERNLSCTKVYGPKSKLNAVTYCSSEPERPSTELGPIVSFISDCEMGADELHALRYAVRSSYSMSNRISHRGVLLRYIWDAYGFIPSEEFPALRYAIVIESAGFSALTKPLLEPPMVFLNISRFHKALSTALNSGRIDESHVVALHLVATASRHRQEDSIYWNMFAGLLRRVNANVFHSPAQVGPRLRNIWWSLVAFHLRTWRAIMGEGTSQARYELCRLLESLPCDHNSYGCLLSCSGFPYLHPLSWSWDALMEMEFLELAFKEFAIVGQETDSLQAVFRSQKAERVFHRIHQIKHTLLEPVVGKIQWNVHYIQILS
jgi:hypothetical protein